MLKLLRKQSEERGPRSNPDGISFGYPFSDRRYHTFELIGNEWITADDLYQDDRHVEFRWQDNIV